MSKKKIILLKNKIKNENFFFCVHQIILTHIPHTLEYKKMQEIILHIRTNVRTSKENRLCVFIVQIN